MNLIPLYIIAGLCTVASLVTAIIASNPAQSKLTYHDASTWLLAAILILAASSILSTLPAS